MNELELQYKRETGINPEIRIVDIYRNWDNSELSHKWIEVGDGSVTDDEIEAMEIEVPDPEYMKWLEDKLNNLK